MVWFSKDLEQPSNISTSYPCTSEWSIVTLLIFSSSKYWSTPKCPFPTKACINFPVNPLMSKLYLPTCRFANSGSTRWTQFGYLTCV